MSFNFFKKETPPPAVKETVDRSSLPNKVADTFSDEFRDPTIDDGYAPAPKSEKQEAESNYDPTSDWDEALDAGKHLGETEPDEADETEPPTPNMETDITEGVKKQIMPEDLDPNVYSSDHPENYGYTEEQRATASDPDLARQKELEKMALEKLGKLPSTQGLSRGKMLSSSNRSSVTTGMSPKEIHRYKQSMADGKPWPTKDKNRRTLGRGKKPGEYLVEPTHPNSRFYVPELDANENNDNKAA